MTSVVLVEDDPDIRELTTLILEDAGFDVRAFSSGPPAIASCLIEPPDIALLDWMLPEMSGLEILRTLRDHPFTAHVPVVIASAVADPGRVAAATGAGAREFVAKPFTRADLVAALRRHTATPAAAPHLHLASA